MKRIPLLAAVLVALGGGAGGFLSYRLLGARPPPPLLSAPATAPIPAAAAAAAGETAPTVPQGLPEIRMPDLLGHPRALSEFAGRPQVLNFWATWCAPCRREIPLLNTLARAHRGEHLQIVGIAVDTAQAVRDYVKSTRIDYPVLIGEDAGLEAAQKFGIQDLVLPFSVFADARNRVVAVKIGELHAEEADFILGAIRQLDAQQTTLPAARAAIEENLKAEAQRRSRPAGPNSPAS